MTILLHKPYLVKVTTKGSKIPKNFTTLFMDDPMYLSQQGASNSARTIGGGRATYSLSQEPPCLSRLLPAICFKG